MSQDVFSDSQLFGDGSDVGGAGDGDGSRSGDEGQEVPLSQMSSGADVLNGKETLMKTNLSEEQIQKTKETLLDIDAQTDEVEKCDTISSSIGHLSKQLKRQDKCFIDGGVSDVMPLESKVLLKNTDNTLQLIRTMQTDSKQFDAMEFAEKLLTAINPFHGIGGSDAGAADDDHNRTANSETGIDRSDWVEFGRQKCGFHRDLPPFVFIHGASEVMDDEAGERPDPKPRARQPKPQLSAQTEATQINLKDNIDEERTPEEVELILNTVKKLEDKNKEAECLPFFNVLANPKSMSETVENIFHTAFLVKDGLVRVVDDNEDGPGIQSVDGDHSADMDAAGEGSGAGIQSVMSFTMRDWQEWCRHFEIKKAAIKHVKKSAN